MCMKSCNNTPLNFATPLSGALLFFEHKMVRSHHARASFSKRTASQGFQGGVRSSKKAQTGGHADDMEEAVAEEPVAEAVPPTPVAAPVQRKEQSPPLVSPPPLRRKFPAAESKRTFNAARSVSVQDARSASCSPELPLHFCFFGEVWCATSFFSLSLPA